MNRGFFGWICFIAALILSGIWLLNATGVIGSIAGWIPPAGLFALVLAVASGWVWPVRSP